jgi:CheY-like chemotaxis protein
MFMNDSVPSKHILLVDDDRFVLEAMDMLLQQAGGFTTYCATGYVSARQRLNELDHLDAIVADIVLAGTTTGIDLCREAIAAFPRIGVVVITGDSSDYRDEIPNRGIYLRKPFSGDKLIDAIHDAVTAD